jgi:hypothetical protein
MKLVGSSVIKIRIQPRHVFGPLQTKDQYFQRFSSMSFLCLESLRLDRGVVRVVEIGYIGAGTDYPFGSQGN